MTDIGDEELAAYPVVDGFDEAGGEEAALHVEIAAQQEVDTTHTQGEQHLDKKVGAHQAWVVVVLHYWSLGFVCVCVSWMLLPSTAL